VETVTSYLQRRPLDEELDRAALVKLGLEYLKQADDIDAAASAVRAARAAASASPPSVSCLVVAAT